MAGAWCVQTFFTPSRAGLRPAAAPAPGRACGLAAGHNPARAACTGARFAARTGRTGPSRPASSATKRTRSSGQPARSCACPAARELSAPGRDASGGGLRLRDGGGGLAVAVVSGWGRGQGVCCAGRRTARRRPANCTKISRLATALPRVSSW